MNDTAGRPAISRPPTISGRLGVSDTCTQLDSIIQLEIISASTLQVTVTVAPVPLSTITKIE